MAMRLILILFVAIGATLAAKCPCKDISLCEPIKVNPVQEIYLFSLTAKNYLHYDWDRITTIVEVGFHDDELVCYAHSQNARVSSIGNIATNDLTNSTARAKWVSDQLNYVIEHHLDGINVDFEDAIPSSDPQTILGLTQLMNELKKSFKSYNKHLQVTFDVAWSPDCIDARCYDHRQIADASDFIFVMAYDQRSQIFGDCIAWANSPYNQTKHGVDRFLELGIPPEKLVLGVPWYGYRYPCIDYQSATDKCSIASVPFRGVNCSDAAGTQVNYPQISAILPTSFKGRQWDSTALSPYFTYKDSATGQVYQMWFDDPESLAIKYSIVMSKSLHGIGMWQVDALDYSNSEQCKTVWRTLPRKQYI